MSTRTMSSSARAASPNDGDEVTLREAMALSEEEAIEALADLLFELWSAECVRRQGERPAA